MTFVSASCEGEKCGFCGCPAQHKVEETIFHDDPFQHRHPLTSYICDGHFRQLMGDRGVDLVETVRQNPPESFIGILEGRSGRTGREEDEALSAFARDKLGMPVHVVGGDYSYDGWLIMAGMKRSGRIRGVVEDANGRLFIHNPGQIFSIEGRISKNEQDGETVAEEQNRE